MADEGGTGPSEEEATNGFHSEPHAEPEKPSKAINERDILENEIRELEMQLRSEREDKRRIQYEAQDEITRELSQAEDRWISKIKAVMEERDMLKQRNMILDEQIEVARVEVNRAVAYRMELEDGRQRLQSQYDNLMRDYDETMHERSQVLEENNRLSEERDKLKQNIKNMSNAMQNMSSSKNDAQLHQMQSKLEHTRRLLHLNMEETATANARRNDTVEELNRLRDRCDRLEEEKDEAIRRLAEVDAERQPIVDQWTTHTVDISLPTPKPNLGVILSGGRSIGSFSTPIYVKDVLLGSPLATMLKRLDHIVIVNDIDVSDMDQRSVHDILRNSHHLKMVIRRRTALNTIQEVALSGNGDLGVELANGVFLNRVEHGCVAERAGLRPGDRLILVNGIPVYEAKQAEEIAKNSSTEVKLGVLTGRKRLQQAPSRENSSQLGKTPRSTLFSKMQEKLFGRGGEKARAVIAKANIESGTGEFYRHGSLRIPIQNQTHELIRTGSLRAPAGSADHKQIFGQLEQFRQQSVERPCSAHADNGSTWPKSREIAEALPRRRPPTRPSVFPVFPPNSPSNQSCRTCSCSSPLSSAWHPSSTSIDAQVVSSTSRPYATGIAHAQRVTTFSPSLPQPPPYPGPRYDDSMVSIASSTNSVPHPSTSSLNYQVNNSPSETLLSECASETVRRVCLSKEGSEFGLGLENSDRGVIISNVSGRANGLVKRGDRLLDVGGINMRSADKLRASKVLSEFSASQDEVTVLVSGKSNPRWIQVPRRSVRLIGGNSVGIVAECSIGELNVGDLILEIDNMDVRTATLEIAISYLGEGSTDMVDLLVDGGGDRLEKLKGGSDGDGFYVRINVDRKGENVDELDMKAGEIVYVDNTLFMGQKGRWRAWRVDREGRQRQCGIIPSAAVIERDESRQRKVVGKPLRTQLSLTRPVYEKVERVNSSQRRPIVLVSAYTAPFTQALLDENINKFTQCVAECRALTSSEVERLLSSGELIDARRRDKLFDVVSTTALQHQMDRGYHVILDVSPQGIQRLHSIRVYPIIIKIKFKSPKQIKELYEENGEKIATKTAKEMLEKALVVEGQLDEMDFLVSTVLVSTQAAVRTLVKHVCQQVVAHVDHEQKKTLWVTAQSQI